MISLFTRVSGEPGPGQRLVHMGSLGSRGPDARIAEKGGVSFRGPELVGLPTAFGRVPASSQAHNGPSKPLRWAWGGVPR
jgi:hypothetical protein